MRKNLLLVLGFWVVASAASAPTLLNADPQRLLDNLKVLAGETPLENQALLSRNIHHPDHNRARDWLVEQFRAIPGMTVELEPFEALGEGLANVVAELPGTVGSSYVILGAHYDSTGSNDPAWEPSSSPAPGADDDASGVVAVLELARIMAQSGPFERTLRFIAFDGEEEGLLGSWTHAEAALARDETIELMLQLDPLGFNPGNSWTLWASWKGEQAQAQEWVDASERSPVECIAVAAADIGGDMRSDHYPFWYHGYTAVHLGAFPTSPNNHSSADTLDTVDMDFLAAIVDLARKPLMDHAILAEVEAQACSCH